jgi:hypothetical protein
MFKLPVLQAGCRMPFGLAVGKNWVADRAKTFVQLHLPLPLVYKDVDMMELFYDEPIREWGFRCLVIRFSWNFICWGTYWTSFKEKTTIL